jgi:hypothetical protein
MIYENILRSRTVAAFAYAAVGSPHWDATSRCLESKTFMNSLIRVRRKNWNGTAARDFGRAPCSGGRLAPPGARAQAPSRLAEQPCGKKSGSLRVCSKKTGGAGFNFAPRSPVALAKGQNLPREKK